MSYPAILVHESEVVNVRPDPAYGFDEVVRAEFRQSVSFSLAGWFATVTWPGHDEPGKAATG